MLHGCPETVESELGVKPKKKKKNLTKIKNQSGKLILKKNLKQLEQRCRYLAKLKGTKI